MTRHRKPWIERQISKELAKQRARQRQERRESLKEEGRCPNCGSHAMENRTLCARCTLKRFPREKRAGLAIYRDLLGRETIGRRRMVLSFQVGSLRGRRPSVIPRGEHGAVVRLLDVKVSEVKDLTKALEALRKRSRPKS